MVRCLSCWPPALPCVAAGQVLVATIIRPRSAMQAKRYRTCLYPFINRWNHCHSCSIKPF
ncbi:hypothetical protein BBCT_0602 [Bifidobacterium catenulatum DSM 16992 = JCM 1194 = LMG 11043]|uniref:Secreted protein n=2 Tax=Bifidobacterium catenulatum DSM 16992 = JCM 1194 = LMG 11043 TaxID=566552 RepID=A0ABM7EUI4_9BIFI|nr:hypothetical protein BIFCAT_01908 [Bifidobacterium catenulatum DSM 16992 = JCM 1194 = LMG 11043]BAR01570.1 hypothetical protein BBCT_0602 [Bifidobacterium catenulatum DSM 16992 = JCM 1194 = LMG 11043]